MTAESGNTLQRLKKLPPLFRKQDAEKVSEHAAVFLSRALKRGIIHRIIRGIYINSFLSGFPPVEEVACFLRPPAYISCEWALNYHGVSLQSPLVCTVVTLNSAVGKNRDIDYQGVTIEFSRIAPSLFFGYSVQNRITMAVPEKAILDTLYYRGNIPASDELDLDHLNMDLLIKMSDKYPKRVKRFIENMTGGY